MAINKKAFLARIASKKPTYAGDAFPGEGSAAEEASESPDEAKSEGDLTCGEQLMNAIDAHDSTAIDDALKEAVRKYGNGG